LENDDEATVEEVFEKSEKEKSDLLIVPCEVDET